MTALKYSSICFALVLLTGEIARGADPRLGMSTAASQYFGGKHVMLPRQPVRRPAPSPQPMDNNVSGKPFQNVYQEPTLSPYLALDLLNDNDTGLPNYYAFYEPLRQQQQASQDQEARIRRLQQQLRIANSTGAVARNPQGGMPTTGTSTQFMNLGGYYPGLR
jgi:hypothetical protein